MCFLGAECWSSEMNSFFSWCSRILFLIFASLKTERHLKSELEWWSTSKNVKRKKWILWHADGICSRYFLLSTDNLIWIFIFLITKKLKWLSGYKKVNEIVVMCENRKKSRFFVYIACDVSVLPFFVFLTKKWTTVFVHFLNCVLN